jgi:MFS transporter, SP family, arabinose:H+ symporter
MSREQTLTVLPPAATDREGSIAYVIMICAVATLGGLLFGFDIAIITGAGPFLKEHFSLDDLSLGWAFSSLLFGCTIGSALAGQLADRHGRRTPLLYVAVLFALTSVTTGMAWDFNVFIAARFLGGIAVGGASILAPMYVAEVAPAAMRGRMGTLYQLAICMGVLISYCLNYALHDIGPWNWRWMFISGVLPSLVFFLLLLRAPETPRYLFKAGREDEALEILARIGGSQGAADELAEIRASFATQHDGWRELLRPGLRRAVLVGFGLAILIHFAGINTIIDYAPIILESTGWSRGTALFSLFLVGLTNAAFTLIAFWVIDRYGRRPLYVVGSLGMAASLGMLIVFAVTDQFFGPRVLLFILAYIACFAACIGPVFWTLVAEIFPNRLRGTGMVVPVLTQWVANAVVVLLFPWAFSQIGKAATFAFLLAVCVLQAVFTWYFVPETKGKTLEEIEQFWRSGGAKPRRASENT